MHLIVKLSRIGEAYLQVHMNLWYRCAILIVPSASLGCGGYLFPRFYIRCPRTSRIEHYKFSVQVLQPYMCYWS
jgi:hypothetical protein